VLQNFHGVYIINIDKYSTKKVVKKPRTKITKKNKSNVSYVVIRKKLNYIDIHKKRGGV
jgi:hypothetical protein